MASTNPVFEADFTIDKVSNSRKAALGALARRICALRPDISVEDIYGCFLARERLGSTAIGAGAAAPHTIHEQAGAPLIQVTRLASPVDFDAADDEAVDLLLCVIGNRHDLKWLHLALPRIAKLANTPDLAKRLRSARCIADAEALLAQAGIYTDRTSPKKAA
jgi:PTS system nitrogen regulatory IIA component